MLLSKLIFIFPPRIGSWNWNRSPTTDNFMKTLFSLCIYIFLWIFQIFLIKIFFERLFLFSSKLTYAAFCWIFDIMSYLVFFFCDYKPLNKNPFQDFFISRSCAACNLMFLLYGNRKMLSFKSFLTMHW